MTTEQLPTYVEDGRPCQLVRVADLLPGDVVLGWQGEPFTFGTIASVEKVPVQSFGADVNYKWRVQYDLGHHILTDGDSWRRIAQRH